MKKIILCVVASTVLLFSNSDIENLSISVERLGKAVNTIAKVQTKMIKKQKTSEQNVKEILYKGLQQETDLSKLKIEIKEEILKDLKTIISKNNKKQKEEFKKEHSSKFVKSVVHIENNDLKSLNEYIDEVDDTTVVKY